MFVYILHIYLKVFKWLKQISGSDIRVKRENRCGGSGSVVLHLFFIDINGKQGVNSLICACRASNGVYLLVFTPVCVGLHAHQPPVSQLSHVLCSEVGAGRVSFFYGSSQKAEYLEYTVFCKLKMLNETSVAQTSLRGRE